MNSEVDKVNKTYQELIIRISKSIGQEKEKVRILDAIIEKKYEFRAEQLIILDDIIQ